MSIELIKAILCFIGAGIGMVIIYWLAKDEIR